eukprot:487630-Pelagomonas_calceolata.AAC.5
MKLMCYSLRREREIAIDGLVWHTSQRAEGGEVFMWGEPWGDFSLYLDRLPRKRFAIINLVNPFHDQKEVFKNFGALGRFENGKIQQGVAHKKPARSMSGSTGLPSQVPGAQNIAAISAGAFHNMALNHDGQGLMLPG